MTMNFFLLREQSFQVFIYLDIYMYTQYSIGTYLQWNTEYLTISTRHNSKFMRKSEKLTFFTNIQ